MSAKTFTQPHRWPRKAAVWFALFCSGWITAYANPLDGALPVPTSAFSLASGQETVAADELSSPNDLLARAGRLESGSDALDDLWRAAELYCQASRQGSTEAQYRLGMMHAFGQGVPASRPLAAALFSLAATQGHLRAAQMLESIEFTSVELPDCVNRDVVPDKATPPEPTLHPELAALGLTLADGTNPAIDRYLLALPAHKRWLVPLTTSLSNWYSLDPKLVLSVMAVESNFDVNAKSPKAAAGLMQLIPGTAERFNVSDAYDATQNLRGGMRYLRWLLSYYRGNITYAAAAYNAGEGRVDRYKGVPPFPETRAYVKRVLGLYGSARHSFDEKLTRASPMLAAEGR